MTPHAKPDKVYRHIDVAVAQAPKHAGALCGDVVREWRTLEATTVVLCDGIGSGVKANLAATQCAARLGGLIERQFSLKEACERLVATMHEARTTDIPFSAFTVAHILNDGNATIYSYESPGPVFVTANAADPLRPRFLPLGSEVIGETHLTLRPGDSLLLTSDGISQAGLGVHFREGWGMSGAATFTTSLLHERTPLEKIPEALLLEAKRLSGGKQGDDTTAALLTCRPGTTVYILTGPPADKKDDAATVARFDEQDGIKVVCGSVTSEIVARLTGRSLEADPLPASPFIPPRYRIDGIDLVTEGAITLNQACNVLDDDRRGDDGSSVQELCDLLRSADRVVFWVGAAQNPSNKSLIFRQLGVQPRPVIVPLLAEKLRKMGKLVVVEYL